jgi:hypothetical protein
VSGDESAAQDVLELLIEVAETYPKFLRKHLQEMVSAMMQVRAGGVAVEGRCRRGAAGRGLAAQPHPPTPSLGYNLIG